MSKGKAGLKNGDSPSPATAFKRGPGRNKAEARSKEQLLRRITQLESTVRELEGQMIKAKETEESNFHLASFPDLNPNPLVEVDFSGRVIYQNPAARRLFPDLMVQGVRHPFLSGAETLLPARRDGKDISVTRVQQIGPFWYHQNIFFPAKWERIRIYGFDITDRKKMEQSIRTANERLTLLSEIAGRLLESQDPQQIVEELCRKVMVHLDCHACFNYLLDGEKQRLRLNAWAGIPEEEARKIEWLNLGVAVCGCAARDGVRIVAENIPESLDPRTDLVRSYGIRAYACHPLLSRGKVIGTLSFGTRSRLSFSDDDLSLMKSVADLVSMAMERIRLYETISRRADELDLLAAERNRDLLKANELLEGVFSSMDLLIAHLDKDFNFIRVNKAYAEADGQEPGFYRGKNHFALFPNEENETLFRKVVETGKPYHAAAKAFSYAEHPERGVTYWDWSLLPVKEPDGTVSGVVLNLVNVTERKKAQQTLRRTEEMLQKVLETLPVGVWVADRDGHIITANPAGLQIWGGARYVGIEKYGEYKGWWADTGKKIEPEEWALARAVRNGETSINEMVEIECFDGKRKIILNSAVPLRGSAGEILGAIVVNEDITERKQAEETLSLERNRMKGVLDNMPNGVYISNRNHEIEYLNPVLEKEFGPVGERKCYEYFNDRKDVCPWCRNEQAFSGQTLRWEWVSPKNGKVYELFDTPIPNADGTLSKLEIFHDITDRKKAEKALQTSSLYVRSLIEASLDPLVTITPQGKIADVNRATEMATGVPREALVGTDFSDYFTDPAEARKGYEKAFQEGSVRDYPLAIRHRSEKVTHVLYNATVYRNESGEVEGVFAAARDITRRKAVEEALQHNEQLLRNVLEQLPVGVWIADKDGVITYGNPAGKKIWAGYRYVGIEKFGEYKAWWVNTGKRIAAEEWAVARAIRKGEISLKEEIEIECFDGSHKIILNSALPLRNEKGEITGAFVINDDITERRETEQRIRQVQKMEALGTLAGGISHDFNNILMPILINSELALLDVKQGVLPSSGYLQLVKEAATRGQELVKQIITFSRQREQPRQPVDINPVVREALKFLRASIPRDIEIRSSIDVEPAVVLADPTQIHQVLMNLCSNAAHSMREKGGVLRVSLTRVEVDPEGLSREMDIKPGSYLRLTVGDNGHGMDPEVRNRAFDPFFTTKKPGEGTGMGLAVVHGIVKNHEGAIRLESEGGKGTTVHVFLPWAQVDEQRKDVSVDPIPTGRERILLIDDEDIQVRTVQHMLERLGYRVIAKTRAPEALETFRSQPDAFDLVITDQTMPEMTGANLAREILSLRPGLPVILYTGYSETLSEEEARSIGIRDFALKPLTVRDLAERIRKVLKK